MVELCSFAFILFRFGSELACFVDAIGVMLNDKNETQTFDGCVKTW